MLLHLPSTLDQPFALAGPDGAGWPTSSIPDQRISLNALEGPITQADPLALVTVAAWCLALRRSGVSMEVSERLKSPYAWRTNLLRSLGDRLPWSDEVNPTGAYFPLCGISGPSRVEAVGAQVARVLHVDEDRARKDLVYCVSEMVRNAEEHSRSETPGTFAAGYFHGQRRVTFAIADNGVGIRRTLLRKRVVTEGEDDGAAILKAIQPYVTGAGPVGRPGAPNNAGMGLHNVRLAAQECGGEMLVWSGDACFRERGRGKDELLSVPRWQGTVVSVSLYPDKVGAFPVSPASGGVGGALDLHFDSGPDSAIELRPPIDSAGFAGDKRWYIQVRPEVEAALEQGQHVRLEFSDAPYTTQSALHALLYEPITKLGPDVLSLLHFSHAGQQIRSVIRLVVGYAMEQWTDLQRG